MELIASWVSAWTIAWSLAAWTTATGNATMAAVARAASTLGIFTWSRFLQGSGGTRNGKRAAGHEYADAEEKCREVGSAGQRAGCRGSAGGRPPAVGRDPAASLQDPDRELELEPRLHVVQVDPE